MFRKIRIILAVLFFAGVTSLLLDFTGALHGWLGWMAKIQFLPAVMAANFVIIAALCLLTILFGRVYCSVICPLGVYQDTVSWLSSRRKGKRARFRPKKELKWLRYGVWVLFVAALVAGVQVFVALLAPYSAWGRIVDSIFAPAVKGFNNLLALLDQRIGTYNVYPREVWLKSLPTLLVAAATLVVVTVLAWIGGRTWCNDVCPVGTTLGFLSRFSMFRPSVDYSKCRECLACERKCKASCIDIKSRKIDYSRCVDCFDCLDSCKAGALKYRFAWGTGKKGGEKARAASDSGRRAFLAGAAFIAADAALGAAEKKVDGGFAAIAAKKVPQRDVPVTPFGSSGVRDFYRRCTACQLCVAACPNNVLRPSSDLSRLMQPEMSYEKGWCRPECTRCSQVCPSGAIKPVSVEEKTDYHVGTARVNRELCIVETDGVSCGNCARKCPRGAIRMVPVNPEDPESLRRPAVVEERCIGCGACENLCPARPFSAITVNGREEHLIKD